MEDPGRETLEIKSVRDWMGALGSGSTAQGYGGPLGVQWPFSVSIGGQPFGAWSSEGPLESCEALAGEPSASPPPSYGKAREKIYTWTGAKDRLKVTWQTRLFEDVPAVDGVLRFHNPGPVASPILAEILPLDLEILPPPGPVILYRANGSSNRPDDFLPFAGEILPKQSVLLSPKGGRSSNGTLPYFNLTWNGGGLAWAIGWSGQWAMMLDRFENGTLRLRAGQEKARFMLRPGETVRTPRILLVPWLGADRFRGHNLLRQVQRDHYLPRPDGRIALPPITQNTFFSFDNGNKTTEENQKAIMPSMVAAGCEAYWLDAGWFEGGWPNGVGSWIPKKEAFPAGLKPVGDEAHRLGMKFVLWLEPERVAPGSFLARKHPEFVHGGQAGGLFKLDDPLARGWLTEFLCERIADWGIDILRIDFNMDPLKHWREADVLGREGITEIRYIEGLYTMWDEIRRRFPSLTIDNCASGGRRIDLETVSRSYPLWQSDTQCCGRAVPVQDQVQNAGLSLFVPLHAAGVWAFDPYTFRSIATTGCSLCPDLRETPEILCQARRMTDEAKTLRPFYLGDYYPLFEVNLSEEAWCGWQYHRPDLGQGFAALFRRPRSPYPAAEMSLRALDPESTYELRWADSERVIQLSGQKLMGGFPVEIPERPGSVLIRYGTTKDASRQSSRGEPFSSP